MDGSVDQSVPDLAVALHIIEKSGPSILTEPDTSSVDPAENKSSETHRRLLLRSSGFDPLPINGKVPPFEKWQTKTRIGDEEIKSWEIFCPRADNTGILTHNTPFLDLDIRDREIIDRLVAEVAHRCEGRGAVLVRYGESPKCGIPFRTDNPFKKIRHSFIAPNGDTEQKIEFLADGQQFVSFGIHPKTLRPYLWFGGKPGEVRHSELPLIEAEEAKELVEHLASIVVNEFGWRPATTVRKGLC